MNKNKYLVLPIMMMSLTGWTAGAAEAPSTQVAAVGDLASLLEGEFTTAPAAADAVGSTPQQSKVLYELAKRVDVPALGTDVVYAELREGARDGHIVWQRLYGLTLDAGSGHITMKPYSFANTAQLAGSAMDTKPLAKLQPADLKPLRGGCVVIWRRVEDGFDGSAQQGSCAGARPDDSAEDTPALAVSKSGLTDRLEGKGSEIVFRRVR